MAKHALWFGLLQSSDFTNMRGQSSQKAWRGCGNRKFRSTGLSPREIATIHAMIIQDQEWEESSGS
ncbi:MAG: hypothetical protein WA705_19985 [Candidatus Ozemobacteraceae bacterium]